MLELKLGTKSVELLQTIEGHNGAIYDVIYWNDTLLTSSADKFVAQWDLKTGKQTNFAIKSDYSSYQIALNPENNILGIGNNKGELHVIDVKERKELRLITQHKDSIFALTYNPFKKHFYSGDREGYFCVWSDKFDLLLSLPLECEKIREITVSEDGGHIAISAQDGIIRILETDYFNTVSELKAHYEGANCSVFQGDFLISGGKDAYIKKWNWKEKKLIKQIPAHNYAVYDLEFYDDGKKLVSVSFDKSIKLWNSEDLSIIERIEFRNKGHRHTVNRIAKIDEQTFATVGDDRKIKVWKNVLE